MSARSRLAERATTLQRTKAATILLSDRAFHMPSIERDESAQVLSDAIRLGLLTSADMLQQVNQFADIAGSFLSALWPAHEAAQSTARSQASLQRMAKQHAALVGLDTALATRLVVDASATKHFAVKVARERRKSTSTLAETLTRVRADAERFGALCALLDLEEGELHDLISAANHEAHRLFLQSLTVVQTVGSGNTHHNSRAPDQEPDELAPGDSASDSRETSAPSSEAPDEAELTPDSALWPQSPAVPDPLISHDETNGPSLEIVSSPQVLAVSDHPISLDQTRSLSPDAALSPQMQAVPDPLISHDETLRPPTAPTWVSLLAEDLPVQAFASSKDGARKTDAASSAGRTAPVSRPKQKTAGEMFADLTKQLDDHLAARKG